jgi:hypothetical protein
MTYIHIINYILFIALGHSLSGTVGYIKHYNNMNLPDIDRESYSIMLFTLVIVLLITELLMEIK